MAPKRVLAFAAVCRNGVAAGTIDSRKGKAIVTPAPVRNVRRDRCFFVMNAILRLLFGSLLYLHLLLERIALNDSKNQRRKPVVIRRRPPDDRTNCRQIVVLHCAAQSISQK